MPTLTMTKGLPASGKTTWAKKQDAKRVNKDDLRAMIDAGKWSKENEKEILAIRDLLIERWLRKGFDVIVDDTNLHPKHEKTLIELAIRHECFFDVEDFTDVPLSECIRRDLRRSEPVGEKVIKNMYNQFLKQDVAQSIPKEKETLCQESTKTVTSESEDTLSQSGNLRAKTSNTANFAESELENLKSTTQNMSEQLFPTSESVVEAAKASKKTVILPSPDLPWAILCDIDGTLAHMNGRRSPFNWRAVGQDDVDQTIADIVRKYAPSNMVEDMPENYIILMSGRDEVCRPQTEKWLDDNFIPYTELLMRPEGDIREDSIVKQELFDKYIRNRYNVRFVLDDRDRVVSMWRGMGLKVLQVAEGDF